MSNLPSCRIISGTLLSAALSPSPRQGYDGATKSWRNGYRRGTAELQTMHRILDADDMADKDMIFGVKLDTGANIASWRYCLPSGTDLWYYGGTMKRKFQKTLELIFHRPTVGNIKWRDIEVMLVDLGAEISEREGSRVGVRLFGDRRVFHRPHPSPDTDKGAVAAIRRWLEDNGVTP